VEPATVIPLALRSIDHLDRLNVLPSQIQLERNAPSGVTQVWFERPEHPGIVSLFADPDHFFLRAGAWRVKRLPRPGALQSVGSLSDLTRPNRPDPAITCHFLIGPSIGSNFIKPVQIPNLGFDLIGIHSSFSSLAPASGIKSGRPLASLSRKPTTGGMPEEYKLRPSVNLFAVGLGPGSRKR
jgi:hypothetical protein